MSDKANDRQVGGDHYKKFEYEPWDFFDQASIHPIMAFAIKYIIRWRDKNGVADLEKAIHCLEKSIEICILVEYSHSTLWANFKKQFPTQERTIMNSIENCDYEQAVIEIQNLIDKEKEQAQ